MIDERTTIEESECEICTAKRMQTTDPNSHPSRTLLIKFSSFNFQGEYLRSKIFGRVIGISTRLFWNDLDFNTVTLDILYS